MFWIPLFKVIIELGQLVQEPCNFSLTMPSSNPRYRTSPPSSCTVGLGKKNINKFSTRTGSHDNGERTLILECIFTSCYLIRVSSSSLIIATTSSSSSDGAEKTSGDSLAFTNSSFYFSVLLYTAGWNPYLYLHWVGCPHWQQEVQKWKSP